MFPLILPIFPQIKYSHKEHKFFETKNKETFVNKAILTKRSYKHINKTMGGWVPPPSPLPPPPSPCIVINEQNNSQSRRRSKYKRLYKHNKKTRGDWVPPL